MGAFLSTILPKSRRPSRNGALQAQQQEACRPRQTSHEAHPNEHITARNSVTSALHALPTELLLEVHAYIVPHVVTPRVSLHHHQMALRATCRRFHAILPGSDSPTQHWTMWDRRAYSHMLRQASFRTLCAEERQGLLADEKIVCCICRAAHAKRCFTPSERKKDPEKRICIGASGILQICPHNRVTYAGLLLQPISIRCNSAHPSTNTGPSLVRVRETEDAGRREIKVEVALPLCEMQVMWGKEKKGKGKEKLGLKCKVLDGLRKANWSVCPHLHTRFAVEWLPPLMDQNVALLEALPGWHDCSLRCGWGRWCPKHEDRKWPTITCSARNCDTRITLTRENRWDVSGVRGTECVFLKTERYLGELRGADDAKWMAQIVEASRLDEDKFLKLQEIEEGGVEHDGYGDGWEKLGRAFVKRRGEGVQDWEYR
ncbi:hypothetical protein BU26DRAFT_568725 [Trematosphaeria pertusa]|uniref:F-box domain-containing protein n=1 Tax=Trematosphaeria pertusa TaxID=390896 RepID=A0A6A6I561_9PLEO|nr:uncharacterized protein BU26DRAFT_568725 [Trematosphaeria pertusa]KAF2244720.1 hypothetical protein BU26DRAFT_568725 [Trematosphaeria pertusa]